jgi:hypothetical protein
MEELLCAHSARVRRVYARSIPAVRFFMFNRLRGNYATENIGLTLEGKI